MSQTTARFDYDALKAATNLRKHKVSFEEAITVFTDPLHSTIADDDHSTDEQRFIAIGQSTQERILFVVYTESETIVRLIGARLATATERNQYEEIS